LALRGPGTNICGTVGCDYEEHGARKSIFLLTG
jgi:hypothetical protein